MDAAVIRKIAQNLYSGHQKDQNVEEGHFSQADKATQQYWIRQARRAVNVLKAEGYLD